MKNHFLIFIFLFLQFFSHAQINSSDSLKKDLENYTQKDSVRVIKMTKYASSLIPSNPYQAVEWYKNCITLAKEVGFYKPIPYFYLKMGSIQSYSEKYDDAITNYFAALKVADDYKNNEPLFDIHFELSEAYRQLNNADLCNFHAQKAFDIAKEEKNDHKILSSIFILAGSYELRNMWDSAAPLLDKTMKMAVALKNEYMQQQATNLIADHYIETGDFDNALKLYKQSLQFQYKTGSTTGIAWVYSVLAMLYTDLNDKQNAYSHADSALAISKRYGLTKELKDAYDALFYCNKKFGDYKKALEYRLIYDSLYTANFNVAAGQKSERARMQLEQERKDAIANAENLEKELKQTRVTNILYAGMGIFAVALAFLFINNRQKQKANTKIEKAYAELKSTQAQLIQSEKMASLGELTAGIAHEIQNPLNFVNNFSEVNTELIKELKDEVNMGNMEEVMAIADDIESNSKKINHHGKRADAIVKGMLQHSRSGSGKKESVDINLLCDEYLRLAYHGLKAKDQSFNVSFHFEPDNNLPKVDVIPQDIGRVLLNLINNAFYAVYEKAKLADSNFIPEVKVSTKEKNGVPSETKERNEVRRGAGTLVEIRVIDNGAGIPDAIKDKIFQPFFTTKPTGEGTGLGLSLSYDIVKAHGGQLKVDTREGEGCTFIIQLPYES